ncbi:hypothetical protein CGRA01v4_10106 [Colletotrichum graminicola]|nr:hypothetical protein CGRA01v4_10106 [Colletotrichum graminicola]
MGWTDPREGGQLLKASPLACTCARISWFMYRLVRCRPTASPGLGSLVWSGLVCVSSLLGFSSFHARKCFNMPPHFSCSSRGGGTSRRQLRCVTKAVPLKVRSRR